MSRECGACGADYTIDFSSKVNVGCSSQGYIYYRANTTCVNPGCPDRHSTITYTSQDKVPDAEERSEGG